MNKVTVLVIGIVLVSLFVYWSYSSTTAGPGNLLVEDVTEVSDQNKSFYGNDEWNFSFEYPNEWSVRIPAFVSKNSLFNLAVEPSDGLDPEIVLINVTSKSWIETARKKMEDRGVVFSETTIDGVNALFAKNDVGARGQTLNYYILVKDEYWIHISGQSRKEAELEQLLESFKFTDQQ